MTVEEMIVERRALQMKTKRGGLGSFQAGLHADGNSLLS